MRLANEIAAAAMEHVQGVLRAGMSEAQAAAGGRASSMARAPAGRVRSSAPRVLARLVGPRIKTFTATTSRPVVEGEPTLFEIWVCADGYWCDHTKNLVLGELTNEYREPSGACSRCTRTPSPSVVRARAFAELDRRIRRGSKASAFPGSRRTRSRMESAHAGTSRRTPTRPEAASSRRRWCLQSSQDAI